MLKIMNASHFLKKIIIIIILTKQVFLNMVSGYVHYHSEYFGLL